MTHIRGNQEIMFDPSGSIFLPKDRLVESFLSLEGDPDDILAALRKCDEVFEQTCDTFQFSLLQSRGVNRLSDAIGDDALTEEVEKRMRFYMAISRALGQTAIHAPV